MEGIQIALIIGGFILVIFFINRKLSQFQKNQQPSAEMMNLINVIQNASKDDRAMLLTTLQQNTRSLNERLDAAARVIGEVNKNIGEMSEIGRGMKELQQFLASPKLRGNIGEQVLKDIITQMFPKNSFHLQYSFKSGEKVDAAIKTAAGILPIDSKFPMENFRKMSESENEQEKNSYKNVFNKDIKKHIASISKKYILPEEGTMDFALMYVPSESVYYEVVNSHDLIESAQKARVYPVSPSTLYAHLQTILLSFEGQKIEERAKEVFTLLRAIKKDYEKVDENMTTLQRHLTNAFNMMSSVSSGFNQLGQKITSTSTLSNKEKKLIE